MRLFSNQRIERSGVGHHNGKEASQGRCRSFSPSICLVEDCIMSCRLQDRKKTIEQVKSFLDTKVAPQELVDEIKVRGTAILCATFGPKA